MLRHARGRELGLGPELSTATARLRLRGWPGWRGEGRGDPARGKEGGVESRRDAWVPRRAGGGLRPSTAAGGAAQRRRQRETENREVGDEVWTDLQFPKSLGALL